ncbi:MULTISPECIES: protein phosphatase 2C domain-containing protein [unclassified Actinobaculum]|uniref:PP2C family protein-serine/threonine phosphatase n=1 Tax=unclassified Actinobaculum TaxID=2609299 RepID=UPI000D52A2DD|nr:MULTISPECIES: protein phosphatase 2C domain-containing protein [unclassified Actinobaculum]AWE43246.1 serine/threonine-protein phosphatase [Actinobaculum sp. 313]RTE49857.1 serine/threonine-protein phosphatase [Actinobaculum sp. 352]
MARASARSGWATDIGMRELNEDSYLADSPVFLVSDGMGGYAAGEVASQTAVRCFRPLTSYEFVTGEQLEATIADAAREVDALAHAGKAPGCTLSGIVLSRQGKFPCARVFNIGDSRTYHLSGAGFSQVTRDHSEVQKLVDAGRLSVEEARYSRYRNVITRALGARSGPSVRADTFLLPLNMGDRFVICSDGLSGSVREEEIAEIARYMEDTKETAETLVQRALGAGTTDNVTVVVVDILDCAPQWEYSDSNGITVSAAPRSARDDTVPRQLRG